MKSQKYFLGLLVLLAFSLSACRINLNFPTEILEGSGEIVSKEFEVDGVDRISLEGFGQLTLRQGDEESLTVTSDDNIIEYVSVDVRGSTLVLDLSEDGRNYNFRPTNGIKFELVLPDVSRVDLTGAWNVTAEDWELDSLRFDLTGAGQVELDNLNADELEINQTGAGSVIVSGKVKGQDVSMSGAGSYFAADLESETALVSISGVGTATVWATETLDVDISSVGNVIYYGSPRVISEISGLGKLISQGDK